MSISYVVCPLETIFWDTVIWDNIDLDKAEKFIENNPMPENTIYPNVNELLSDIKLARGTITFTTKDFQNEKNRKFFDWFMDLLSYSL
ncbi:MAG: hypothetical protein ACTSVB_05520 [Candidatus Heimdallarchaeaceae archaeon]